MQDLFEDLPDKDAKARDKAAGAYTAKDIEVLEGLEPVRRRPGMYIGGTDEAALHHLAAELLDNAMDEAVAGHATRIEVALAADGTLTVRDNGRGIPVDPHPKFKKLPALQVILTTLHSGGKFGAGAYKTSGGLHGVGLSVVNALSDRLIIEVARDGALWIQDYARGVPVGKLKKAGNVKNRRGTSIAFHPDPEIFGAEAALRPARLYRMTRSKAYLFRGVEIRWQCDPALLDGAAGSSVPETDRLHFPGGLVDFLGHSLAERPTLTTEPFAGEARFPDDAGKVEWALAWPADGEGFVSSYCNIIPTPLGGSHESGLRAAILRGFKAYGELTGNRAAQRLTAEDAIGNACVMLSVFLRDPQFQGQTKEKLATPAAARLVEAAVKDHFDHWLSADPARADGLLAYAVERAEDRLRRKQSRELARKSATRKARLPGKLTDCTQDSAEGTELFLVEGDSAGGSAKQARDRRTQAILPLRGKILNVASATADKMQANQEIRDMVQALGCGTGAQYREADLRYDRVVIMTDADVDGAHIASLLMTFFFKQMPGLVAGGHLYLAMPPLYRLSRGGDIAYARDDAHREALMADRFAGAGKVEISRFKGLGEMPAAQLKETTMDPATRSLWRVTLADGGQAETAGLVERLMGRKPETRFAFIQENAALAGELDI